MSLGDSLVRKVNIQGYTIWYFTLCLLKIVFLRKLGWHLTVLRTDKPFGFQVISLSRSNWRVENWRSWRKPLGAETRTNSKRNPHMVLTLGFKPRLHMWEASALKTVPSICDPFLPDLASLSVMMFTFKQNYWKNCYLNWFTLIFVFKGSRGSTGGPGKPGQAGKRVNTVLVYSTKHPTSN